MAELVEQLEKTTLGFDRWTVKDKSTINFGAGSTNVSPASTTANKPYYVTTAINYANGPAHMGHAYEGVTADIIARYFRTCDSDGCYFVTGADEHGQKIAGTAEANGMTPIDNCNKYVTGFQALNQRELVSQDDYVRTTSTRHMNTCKELWRRCAAKGDIYLDNYSGWYNVREEAFVTENDAKLTDYKDAVSGLPLKQVEEQSYFFKMSKYQQQLIDHITTNPESIQPETQRKFILARLQEPLRDLSISRTTFSWGIPVPEGFEKDHVMYVWFDALTNYLTGVDYLGANGEAPAIPNLKEHWPADVHLIGKDIIWFHTVIWPTMLMSCDIPLAKSVFAHGFINDGEGKKMSKSLGNVIDPHDVLDKFNVDSFRWYLAKEAPFGGELSFSETSLATMHNADLCDTLGNLVHRATNLCEKFCGGLIPDVPLASPLPIDLAALKASVATKMKSFSLDQVAHLTIASFRDINGYLTEAAPWKLKGDENAGARQTAVKTTLECIYACAHFLIPFIPSASAQIFEKFGTQHRPIDSLSDTLENLTVGQKISVGEVLFTKIVSDEEKSAEEKKKANAATIAAAQAKKKAVQAANVAKSLEAPGGDADENQSDFTRVEIRVGRIEKVWFHPDADKLLCEEIDVGEEKVRQIASGLRMHYSLEEMQGKLVCVVCNLKSAKIVGFASNGMVLCAKKGESVELMCPPEGSVIGERVVIEGLTGEALSSSQIKKRKTWEAMSKDLKSNDKCEATWQGGVIKTSAGVCVVKSLTDAGIS
jgi:methionyl-tRNA synthetase